MKHLIIIFVIVIFGVPFASADKHDPASRLNAEDLFELGRTHVKGHSAPQDLGKAREIFERAIIAETDTRKKSILLNLIGDVYFKGGQGEIVDAELAVLYYRRSTLLGNPHAYYKLGEMYVFGKGVSSDVEKAQEYFARAEALWRAEAEAGNASASLSLARAYVTGRRGKVDLDQAILWYLRAFELGYANQVTSAVERADLFFEIGSSYVRRGRSGSNDTTQAKIWFERAIKEDLNSGDGATIDGYDIIEQIARLYESRVDEHWVDVPQAIHWMLRLNRITQAERDRIRKLRNICNDYVISNTLPQDTCMFSPI
jgi:TPR repeat protein